MAHVSYTVQPTDRARGLQGLAQLIYGLPDLWVVLYEINRSVIGDDPSALRPGQQLIIPLDPDLLVHNLTVHVHQVHPSDYDKGLAGIALRHYGDASRWEEIYRVNRGIIGDDPAQLQTGQLLIIP